MVQVQPSISLVHRQSSFELIKDRLEFSTILIDPIFKILIFFALHLCIGGQALYESCVVNCLIGSTNRCGQNLKILVLLHFASDNEGQALHESSEVELPNQIKELKEAARPRENFYMMIVEFTLIHMFSKNNIFFLELSY